MSQDERRKEVLGKLHETAEVLDVVLAPPRKRVAREWLWVVILVIVVACTFLASGCIRSDWKTEEQRHKDFIKGREAYYSKHFIEIEYKGHTYIYYSRNERMGLVHAGHCEGSH